MWLGLGIAYIAGLSVVDFTLFNYIGFYTGISDMDFGIIGAAWSTVFMLSSELLGRLADRGNYRLLAIISLASATAMASLLVASRSLVILTAAYMFHALSVASANLSLSTGIFELEDYSRWSPDVQGQRLGLYGLRGMALLAIALLAPTAALVSRVITAAAAIVLAVAAAYVALLPSAHLYGLFRKLNRLERNLSLASPYLLSVGALTLGRVDLVMSVANGLSRARGSRPMAVSASAFMATFVGDYMLTALPLMLRGTQLTFGPYALAFGVAALLGTLLLLFIASGLPSKALLALLLAVRGLWLLAGLRLLVLGLLGLIIYTVGYVALFALIDIYLYTYYYTMLGGYGVHGYMIMREMGSMVGSLMAGLALMAGQWTFLAVPSAVATASVVAILAS